MLRPAQLLRIDTIASHITENPATLTVVLCIAWILPGLIGHDPWKPDEAYTFGVVYQLLTDGGWIVPTLAGEPYLEKPPLIYLSAALTALLFSPILPLHDGARIATGIYVALTFVFIALTAKELYGREKSWVAALMLLGCGGLLLRGHQLAADTALLAGLAMGLYALALTARRPLVAGLWLGTGLGISVFSTGLVEPVMLLLTMAILPIVSPHWRTRRYVLSVAVAAACRSPVGHCLAAAARSALAPTVRRMVLDREYRSAEKSRRVHAGRELLLLPESAAVVCMAGLALRAVGIVGSGPLGIAKPGRRSATHGAGLLSCCSSA